MVTLKNTTHNAKNNYISEKIKKSYWNGTLMVKKAGSSWVNVNELLVD